MHVCYVASFMWLPGMQRWKGHKLQNIGLVEVIICVYISHHKLVHGSISCSITSMHETLPCSKDTLFLSITEPEQHHLMWYTACIQYVILAHTHMLKVSSREGGASVRYME